MASRYNNNIDDAPLLVCLRRAGKMEQIRAAVIYFARIHSQNRYDRRNASFI